MYIVALGIIIAVICWAALFAVLYYVRSIAHNRRDEVLAAFAGQTIVCQDAKASFFGQRSKGTQLRGNGILVLTQNELYFKMWIPAKELRIPVNTILSIESPKWFLGKSRFSPLLQVNFQNELGEVDAAAWQVQNLAEWQAQLSNLKHAA